MKQTISILLNNRFNDAERIIGLFSATGYKIEKMTLTESDDKNLSKLVIIADAKDKNIPNFLARLRGQIRVVSVECVEGDNLPNQQIELQSQ